MPQGQDFFSAEQQATHLEKSKAGSPSPLIKVYFKWLKHLNVKTGKPQKYWKSPWMNAFDDTKTAFRIFFF